MSSYTRKPQSSQKKDSWPYKTDADLKDAGFVFVERGRCRGQHCKAEIEWWRTPRQRMMPLDPGTMQPHWATCPDSKQF